MNEPLIAIGGSLHGKLVLAEPGVVRQGQMFVPVKSSPESRFDALVTGDVTRKPMRVDRYWLATLEEANGWRTCVWVHDSIRYPIRALLQWCYETAEKTAQEKAKGVLSDQGTQASGPEGPADSVLDEHGCGAPGRQEDPNAAPDRPAAG